MCAQPSCVKLCTFRVTGFGLRDLKKVICAIISPLSFSRCVNTSPLCSAPQFAAWVDAVVFVFSLEDEISFQTVYNYFLRLSSYRNTAEVPMVLVGTQGGPDMHLYLLSVLALPSHFIMINQGIDHNNRS